MKTLYIVTGANGHLGKTIIRFLKKQANIEIRGLLLFNEHCDDEEHVHYIKGDVRKIETLERLFVHTQWRKVYVIHTAGIINIQEKVSKLLYDVNVTGTKNIIALCQRYHVKRLLYVSSVHAITILDPLQVISETKSFHPDTVLGGYAKSKAEATKLVLEAVDQGLNAVIVHPSGIIGPYGNENNHLVQMIIDYLSGKLVAGVQGGYDFVDVRDVAKGILLALEKGETGECYILSNRYYPIKEVLEMVHRETGKRKLSILPTWLAQIGIPLINFIAKWKKERPLYTRYSLMTLQSNARFSHDKATQKLGYMPRDLKDTIKDTILWYQKKEIEEE
ncbi:MAG: NAD-dependent epimerase/dehydratase family protein [Erysipelotrichia bacterium]|nr:NAD-dependent epimerase/dehydratase family protein [Erysipelotrichia bacterium]NCC54460.1 NAD-dependent epimerase/dehydratase family protein [Erysipelotrichia bacterium]